MNCSQCGNKVVECDYCGTAFECDDSIICVSNGEEHLHLDCIEDWTNMIHGFEEGVISDNE